MNGFSSGRKVSYLGAKNSACCNITDSDIVCCGNGGTRGARTRRSERGN
jgi:hypothetical protein